MEMSSTESPYFKSQMQIKEECQAPAEATLSRQTRSATSKQASKIKLDADVASESLNAKTKKIRKKVTVSVEENISSDHSSWVPENWEAVLNNIRCMRKARDAPVDHMGAEKCADEAGSPEVWIFFLFQYLNPLLCSTCYLIIILLQVKRFQVLVSLMLSSQTKDQVTFAAMEKLRKHGLTVENIIKTDENVKWTYIFIFKCNNIDYFYNYIQVIANMIHPVGFWKVINAQNNGIN